MNRKKILIPVLLTVLLVLAAGSLSCRRQKPADGSSGAVTEQDRSAATSEEAGESTEEGSAGYRAEIAGFYEITAMVTGGKETPAEDLELMKSQGLSCTILLQTNGSGVLNLFGEESAMVWNEETISTSRKRLTYTFTDEKLVLTDGESTLTFTRVSR